MGPQQPDSIEWLPTWSGIQNADLTLSSQRGNSMDIASLTIALLRASQIPARYVHGTIDVPSEAFNNWAGGFDSIDAATDYASAGGIPLSLVVSGGKITKIRLEHLGRKGDRIIFSGYPQLIKAKQLPDVIQQRHDQTVATYRRQDHQNPPRTPVGGSRD